MIAELADSARRAADAATALLSSTSDAQHYISAVEDLDTFGLRAMTAVLREALSDNMVRDEDEIAARLRVAPRHRWLLRSWLTELTARRWLSRQPGGGYGTLCEQSVPARTELREVCADLGFAPRFERVDNGTLHWIDIDLPDAMDLRSKFFTESDRRRMVAASVLEETWIDIVKAFPAPYFLIAEGVLIYLDEPDVRRALTLITANFPGAHLVLDTSGRWIIDHQDRHDAMKKVTARMQWACDDPRELERWHPGLRTLESRDLSQLPDRIRPRVPLPRRITLRAVSTIFRQRFNRYKINLYRIDSPTS